MDDVFLDLMGATTNMIRAVIFLRRGLDDIGIAANLAKIVVLLPTGHVLTVEKMSLLENVDVRIAE